MKVLITYILVNLLFMSCNRQEIYICSPDESQCITVLTRAFSDVRYVIDGKHISIPETNYVKLKLSNHYSPGDAINICWENDKYEWEAIIDKSTIVISKLDPDKFLFKNELDVDNRDVPTENRFRQDGCATVSLYSKINIVPEGNAIVYKNH
jgi:hypothetical protein